MKKTVVTILVVCMLALTTTKAYAVSSTSFTDENIISPNYTYILLLSSGLDINSAGKAHCSGSVDASSNSYTAKLTVALQKYSNDSWQTIKSWSDSGSGQSNLIIEKYYYVANGTYRVCTTAKIYNSSGTLLENKSVYSDEEIY